MNVADAMTPRSEVVTVSLPGTRDDALEYLQEGSFTSLPVVKEEEYRGLVTRDALIENPDEDQLALLMEEVPTTDSEASVGEVAHLMVDTGERRIPVVDGDRLEGIITVTDVVRAIASGDVETEATVGEVAGREINTTYRKVPLPVVERQLYYANLPYAVVLDDDGESCGMVTSVDVLAVAEVVEGEASTGESLANEDDDWMWEGIKAVGNRYLPTRNVELPDEPVEEFMTEDLVTASRRKPVAEVARTMIRNDIEQLPVVNGGDLVGVARDIHLLEAL